MHTEVVRFYFRKVDGTLREAWGTLRSDIVPPVEGNDTRKKNDTVQVYYDTERQEWRCFKRLSLI
ncbi:SH3 beta-barrel fold-containing protein [Alistipes putredinis]|uniref:SH3 beta-barrel fold-containing protein n=1 Tax=Alistipes putredinis TaxID=28117 RepID=UPI002AC363F3|nr:SH3 beta-barrel fold-containing protein [Alistipes putredinis]